MKQLTKICVLLFGIAFFTNCQKDDKENEIYSRNISIKEYSFKELNEFSKFKNSFGKILNDVKDSKGSNIENDQSRTFNFVIDSSTVKEIIISNRISYTFSVTSENQEGNTFKNLVLQLDSINNARAFLITYFPDNPINFNEPHHSFSFQGTKTVEEITANSSKYQNRNASNCIETFYCTWGGSLHFAGENCTAGYIFSTISCGGGGGGGGGTLPYEPNVDPVPFFTAPVIISMAEQLSNFITLTPEQKQWANKQTQETISEITTFLLVNCGIDSSTTECSEAQQEVIEEINSEIIERKIIDVNLDDCTRNILTNLKNLQVEDISKILNRFGDINSIYNWEIKTGTPTNPSNRFETQWQLNNSGVAIPYNYTTIVNTTFVNQATDLAIARVIIHEAIHSYILSFVDDLINDPISNQQNFEQNFPEVWNYYVAKKNGIQIGDIEDAHHEQMASNYIQTIGAALAELDNNQQDIDYYYYLAWGGLFNTDAWHTALDYYDYTADPYSVIDSIIIANQQEDTNGLDALGLPCP